MKINKLERKPNNEKVDEHVNLDRETQRLKWRTYKRKYRQKIRKNTVITKHEVQKQEKKTVMNKRNGKDELRTTNNIKTKIRSFNTEVKPIESVKKLNISEVIEQTVVENSKVCPNENTNREILREKWRQYKKRYREKKKKNKALMRINSRNLPKIVEEDTAIYFVEDDFNADEFMYENEDNENSEYECNTNEFSLQGSIEIDEPRIETITIACEPSTCFFT